MARTRDVNLGARALMRRLGFRPLTGGGAGTLWQKVIAAEESKSFG